MSDYLIGQQVPPAFRSSIPQNEDILAVLKQSSLWMFNPLKWIFPFPLYHYFITHRNTVLILTRKRIIGCLNPKLFTKDKIDLPIARVDGMYEDESFFGNMLGYSSLRVDTNGYVQRMEYARKLGVKEFKDKFYSLL